LDLPPVSRNYIARPVIEDAQKARHGQRNDSQRLESKSMRSSKSRSRNKNRNNNRPSGGSIINRVFDSSGPDGKVRGTPQQIIEKYNQLHRDAQLSNDRVNAENFAQHAEHYTRMLAEAQREVDQRREEQEAQNRERQAERDRERQDRIKAQEAAANAAPDAEQPAAAGLEEQPDIGVADQPDTGLVETPEEKPKPRARKPRAPRKPKPEARPNDDSAPEAAE
jgi:hypothetical protein